MLTHRGRCRIQVEIAPANDTAKNVCKNVHQDESDDESREGLQEGTPEVVLQLKRRVNHFFFAFFSGLVT